MKNKVQPTKPAKSKGTKNQYIPATEFYSQVIDSLQDYSIFTFANKIELAHSME